MDTKRATILYIWHFLRYLTSIIVKIRSNQKPVQYVMYPYYMHPQSKYCEDRAIGLGVIALFVFSQNAPYRPK